MDLAQPLDGTRLATLAGVDRHEPLRGIDLTGVTVGGYQVRGRIGSGGMADVYRAVQQSLGREVALKVLGSSLIGQGHFIERFEQEARTVAQLDHPNILAIFDFGIQGDVAYLAMPLVRDGTLRERLDTTRCDLSDIWNTLEPIAQALHHAHESGMVHRDVKPTNILIHEDGRLLLADFGLVRSGGLAALSTYGLPIGTPGYMPPEQALGNKVDRRADIYALGVLLYEMLTGTLPLTSDTPLGMILAAMEQRVPLPSDRHPGIPIGLDDLVLHAIAEKAGDRPATALDFLAELRDCLPAEVRWLPVSPAPDTRTEAPTRPSQGAPPGATPISPLPVTVRSALDVLSYTGVRKLKSRKSSIQQSYLVDAVAVARLVAADRWPHIAELAGLAQYLDNDPTRAEDHFLPVEQISRLHDAFGLVFDANAPDYVRQWGRGMTELMLQRVSTPAEQRALPLLPLQSRKVAWLLNDQVKRLDHDRGERLHITRQLGPGQYWVVHCDNMYAIGRRTREKSCYVITSMYETLLRSAGLANDWLVRELECGCVTGSGDCLFAITSTREEALA